MDRNADREAWLIWYDDADQKPEIFTGDGATVAAAERFRIVRDQWNCHLFRRVAVG